MKTNIISIMAMAMVMCLGLSQAHAVNVPLVQDAFWDDGFTAGVATPTQFMCSDYVSLASPSTCTSHDHPQSGWLEESP